jgi:plastocyanin
MRVIVFLIVIVTTAACAGGSSMTPVSPTPPVGNPAPAPAPSPTPTAPTITITANGMTPLEITITVGQKVTFVNNDLRSHDVVGGVDPAHPDCPEILVAGFLTPGQSRDTGIFTSARTCEYHDHTALSVPAFQGRMIIR